MRPFVVEFVGLRGVGKSTLAGEVIRALLERETACNRLEPGGLSRKLALRLESYGRLAAGFAFVASRRPVSWTALRQCARAYTAVTSRLAQCRGSGIHVMDEGIFQLGARISRATRHQDVCAICQSLLQRLPLPDLVVVVEAPLETVEARRRLRGNTGDRLYKRPSAAAVRDLRNLKGMLQRLSFTTPGLGYLQVANDEGTPPRDVAARVATLVLERYRTARGEGR